MKDIFTFVLLAISFYGFSQKNYQTDTIYYSDDTRYEYLAPHLKVGQAQTYKVSTIDIDIENGDTTKHEKKENIFSYTVTGKNDTAYFVELALDDETWESILFKKGQSIRTWQPDKVPPLIFQINKKGNEFQIHNCEQVYDYLLPFVSQQVEYNKKIGNTGAWMRYIEDLPERIKDCHVITATFNSNLSFLHQLYGTPVPIDNILKYELKPIGNENLEGMSVYMKIEKTKLPNGHIKYAIMEDDEMGKKAMDYFYQSILGLFTEIDSTIAERKVAFGSTDFSHIIFDKNAFPVEVFREMTDFRIRDEYRKEGYFFFKIEKMD